MGTDPGTSFVVMTYNIGNGMVRPARLVRCLIESGADVIGLQELDEAQAAAIGRETIERFPYQIVRGTGFSGRGLLSRFPIVGHEWLELSPVRPDLRVAVAMEGTDVTVVVAHPPPPRLSRRGIVFDRTTVAQIERLGEIVRSAGPAVLVGDLNMTSRHPMYARLVESGLRDAHRTSGAGRGATFPARPGRIQRFDHPFSWVP